MSRWFQAVRLVYYIGLTVLLVAILSETLADVMPAVLAKHIGFNSEGYVVALLVPLWIQFARPRLAGRAMEWPGTTAAAIACLAIGVWMYNVDVADLPSRFKTLNEAFIACGLVIPYVQVRRPFSTVLPAGLTVVLVAIVAFGQSNTLVTNLAETFGVLVLVPPCFDLVDRGILWAGATSSEQKRYAWYAFLFFFPFLSSLGQHVGVGHGFVDDFTHYTNRANEGFVGVILLELFLAVGQGRTVRGSDGLAGRSREGSIAT